MEKVPFDLDAYSRNLAKIYFPYSDYDTLPKLPNGVVDVGREMIRQFEAKSGLPPSLPNNQNPEP